MRRSARLAMAMAAGIGITPTATAQALPVVGSLTSEVTDDPAAVTSAAPEADDEPGDSVENADSQDSSGEEDSDDGGELRVGAFDPDGVVVQPGQPMTYGEYATFGARGCTTAFVAADEAYLAGEAHGNRYLLTAGHCIVGEQWGTTTTFAPGDGDVQYLAPMNPSVSGAAGRPAGMDELERFGTTRWYDQRDVVEDHGTGPLSVDAGVILLDDAVSVDPTVPEIGTPGTVAQEHRTLVDDGPSAADRVEMYGRAAVLGDAAGHPTVAHRTGQVTGVVGSTHVCTDLAVSYYDSGAPVLTDDLRAVGVVAMIAGGNVEDHTLGDSDTLCGGTTVVVTARTIIERFEEATGIRLHLLTGKAGPILR